MLYFAYGSNLDWTQMRRRCPSARFACLAELREHRLAFTRASRQHGCGVADVIAAPGETVWGVVYALDAADLTRLDAAEGFQPQRAVNAYQRRECQVFEAGQGDKPVRVWIYMATAEANSPLPSPAYKQLIVAGAGACRRPISRPSPASRPPLPAPQPGRCRAAAPPQTRLCPFQEQHQTFAGAAALDELRHRHR